MRISNQVASQPIGYYESTKSLGVDLPCRLTHYTREHLDKFKKGFDYIKAVDRSYKELNPEKHKIQLERALEKPDFQIEDTAFSTFTINRNFQTGVHQDKGDYGFGNLTVLERGRYRGGYFVIPQYGIGIDLRSGDHLCVDVHRSTEIHKSMKLKAINNIMKV
jgi:thymine dioxygenase / DNA helicase